MKPIRILHIVGRMDRAGAETMVMNLYRAIDRGRFQFDFTCFTSDRCDYDEEILALGGRIIRIPGGGALSRFFRLWYRLRGGEWRVVHSHTLFSSGLHLLAAKLAGVPVRIAHSHSTADANSRRAVVKGYQWFSRKLLSRVPTGYAACGRAAASYLFPGRSGVTIIPNAINVPEFLKASGSGVRQELGIDPGRLLVVQVGRLLPVKNHAFSLRIAEALRESGHEFQMLFIGSGHLTEALEADIRTRALERNVRLVGVREDIAALMGAADVMLMPSLYEGFPVVLVESQAAGLPAVVSRAVSPEVDLGLGLIDFVDLGVAPADWAARLVVAASKPSPDPGVRRETLTKYGFSADGSALRLARMYDES